MSGDYECMVHALVNLSRTFWGWPMNCIKTVHALNNNRI